jgi:hypothetical protein
MKETTMIAVIFGKCVIEIKTALMVPGWRIQINLLLKGLNIDRVEGEGAHGYMWQVQVSSIGHLCGVRRVRGIVHFHEGCAFSNDRT